MLVQQILKSKGDGPVITISAGTLISEAAHVLAERRIGGLIVSDDGQESGGNPFGAGYCAQPCFEGRCLSGGDCW